MKRRKWFTRTQGIFLLAVLNVSCLILGAIFLSKCHEGRWGRMGEALVSVDKEAEVSSSSGYYAVPEVVPDSFMFDPNDADSTQLLRLGLAPFQVRSIYRYRAKGGRFSTKDDFRRVYPHQRAVGTTFASYKYCTQVPVGDHRATFGCA